VDAAGRLRSVLVTPGRAGENPRLFDVLGMAGCRVARVVADKAFPHPSTRRALRARGIKATIPERHDQIARRKAKGSLGGRPPAFDQAVYKTRNVVERFFARVKHFRAVATRYDKHARNYRAGIVLAGIITCLRDTL
jgi:transposase